MDKPSINMIDLQSFSNPEAMRRLNKIQKNETRGKTIDKEELDFYKIRIFNISKEILQNKTVEPRLTELFHQFANQCISHFKFLDKSDNIQNDYVGLEEKTPVENFIDISNSHLIMMKKKTVKIPKITDHIKVKTTIVKKPFLPKERKLNLRDPKYKIKGIKKKGLVKKTKEAPKNKEIEKNKGENKKNKEENKKNKEENKKNKEENKKNKGNEYQLKQNPLIKPKTDGMNTCGVKKNTGQIKQKKLPNPNIKKRKNKKKGKNKILNLYIDGNKDLS